MSDAAATPKAGKTLWTDAEKMSVFFSIVSKIGGSIPWSELDLPEGRTVKACQVMLDKEKSKVKAAMGGATPATPASRGKKRGPKAADADDETPAKKKRAPPKKKAAKAAADEEDDDEAMKSEEGAVKAETTDEV